MLEKLYELLPGNGNSVFGLSSGPDQSSNKMGGGISSSEKLWTMTSDGTIMSLEQTEALNFYFADDAPEKKETTRRFFDKVKQGEYEVFISDAVMGEIDKAGDKKKKALLTLIKKYEPQRLIINEEILRLARMYVSDGIFPVNKIEEL